MRTVRKLVRKGLFWLDALAAFLLSLIYATGFSVVFLFIFILIPGSAIFWLCSGVLFLGSHPSLPWGTNNFQVSMFLLYVAATIPKMGKWLPFIGRWFTMVPKAIFGAMVKNPRHPQP